MPAPLGKVPVVLLPVPGKPRSEREITRRPMNPTFCAPRSDGSDGKMSSPVEWEYIMSLVRNNIIFPSPIVKRRQRSLIRKA